MKMLKEFHDKQQYTTGLKTSFQTIRNNFKAELFCTQSMLVHHSTNNLITYSCISKCHLFPALWLLASKEQTRQSQISDFVPGPIIDSSNACNQASAPIVYTPLHEPVQFVIHRGVRLVGNVSPKIACFPSGIVKLHVTRCSSGQAHSSSQTASRSVQPLLYGSQILCCTMHCSFANRKEKPPNLPFPSEGRWSHGHRQHLQKCGKDRACGSEYIIADRQTHRHTQTYSSQYFSNTC